MSESWFAFLLGVVLDVLFAVGFWFTAKKYQGETPRDVFWKLIGCFCLVIMATGLIGRGFLGVVVLGVVIGAATLALILSLLRVLGK